MEVLLDLPPLDLYLQGQALNAHARLSMNHQWQGDPWEEILNELQLPQDKIPKRVSPDDSIRGIIPKAEEWQGQLPSVISRQKERVVIYTDGSLMDEKSGCGVYCEQPPFESSVALGATTSVFQAEIYAVREALEFISSLPPSNVFICCDSQAAILALSSSTVTSSLVRECRKVGRQLRSQHHSIELVWVPGHAGHTGNEEADRLARHGSSHNPVGPQPFIPVGPAVVGRTVKEYVYQKWANEWSSHSTMRTARAFIRGPRSDYGLHNLKTTRSKARAITALLTGHGPFRQHLSRMSLLDNEISALCRLCQQSEETAEHLMCHCPSLWRKRHHCLNSPFPTAGDIRDLPLASIARFIEAIGLTGW